MILPAAYKWVAVAIMLAEINYCADRLELPIKPISREDVQVLKIAHPELMGFSGRIETDSYFFVFYRSGRLSYIVKKDESKSDQSSIVFRKSLISTNEAYELAKGWLSSINIDVTKLENEHKPATKQRIVYNKDYPIRSSANTNESKLSIPLFDVKWGELV